jgi:transposase
MAETRRKFEQDFKEGAVRLVRETGKPIAQIARELGIHDGTLGNWVNADRRRRGEDNGGLGEDQRAELVRLRRENAELRMRCDVLKRSVALWVQDAVGRWPWPPSSPPRGPGTASRTRWRAGRWGCRSPGSTSGATGTPRCGGPAGDSLPTRSVDCLNVTRVGTGPRGSPPIWLRPGAGSVPTPLPG